MIRVFINRIKRKDIIISLLILGVTFGYYLDAYIPAGIVKIDLYFFEIGSFGFDDILELVQYIKMKLLIICFSVIWYFTCRHWWKPAILVLITIELLKLFSIFNMKQSYLDELEYFSSLPITIPIILLLLFVSNKLKDYNLAKKVALDIDKEIDIVFFELNESRKFELNILKQKFLNVKKLNNKIDKIAYLKELKVIRDEFYKS